MNLINYIKSNPSILILACSVTLLIGSLIAIPNVMEPNYLKLEAGEHVHLHKAVDKAE